MFYEQSTEDFKAFGETFVHHAKMTCNSGLELNFLQEFYLVALDVFRKSEYASTIDPKDRLVGWLSFFCTENAEDAETLCRIYPWLSELYVEMAQFGRNPEELIGMFSEMLREMDRNTIRYMVDDMKEQIEKGKTELAGIKTELTETKTELTETKTELTEAKTELTETKTELTEAKTKLAEKDAEIARLKALIGNNVTDRR